MSLPTESISSTGAVPDLTIRRVRHPLRFRLLEVCRVDRLTPHLLRVTLQGDALDGFVSTGFDDHVKVFFPDPVTGELLAPALGDDGPIWPEGKRPVMRDYTPGQFDPVNLTLQIDFALHQPGGPATCWAEQAQVGQRLGIAGPKGSFMVPTGFDWHLLVGDDTGLPAIAKRLAELPAGARAEVLMEVDSHADHIPLPSLADVNVVWVHREQHQSLLDALAQIRMPSGHFYSWIACESAQAKAMHAFLINECRANPKWVRASGYWRKGSTASHESFDH
jgi:NADPH-dependent ferric siderophore reductase